MRTVYHDRLQMSFCGQCTLLWKWFRQWKRGENTTRIKRGNEGLLRSVSVSVSLSFSLFLGPSVVCNRRDGNWFPGELFHVPLTLRETIILHPAPPPLQWGPCDSHAVLCRESSEKDRFNCSFQYAGAVSVTRSRQAFPPAAEHYLSIRQLICWSIRWRAILGKSKARISKEKEQF